MDEYINGCDLSVTVKLSQSLESVRVIIALIGSCGFTEEIIIIPDLCVQFHPC